MANGVFCISRVRTFTKEKPQAASNMQQQPIVFSVVPEKNFIGFSVLYSVYSSFCFVEDIAIRITPTKLKIIAITGKHRKRSPSINHAKIAVQKGAVLNIVISTTIGTMAIPKVIDVNATVTAMDLMNIFHLSTGLSIEKLFPYIQAVMKDSMPRIKTRMSDMSRG